MESYRRGILDESTGGSRVDEDYRLPHSRPDRQDKFSEVNTSVSWPNADSRDGPDYSTLTESHVFRSIEIDYHERHPRTHSQDPSRVCSTSSMTGRGHRATDSRGKTSRQFRKTPPVDNLVRDHLAQRVQSDPDFENLTRVAAGNEATREQIMDFLASRREMKRQILSNSADDSSQSLENQGEEECSAIGRPDVRDKPSNGVDSNIRGSNDLGAPALVATNVHSLFLNPSRPATTISGELSPCPSQHYPEAGLERPTGNKGVPKAVCLRASPEGRCEHHKHNLTTRSFGATISNASKPNNANSDLIILDLDADSQIGISRESRSRSATTFSTRDTRLLTTAMPRDSATSATSASLEDNNDSRMSWETSDGWRGRHHVVGVEKGLNESRSSRENSRSRSQSNPYIDRVERQRDPPNTRRCLGCGKFFLNSGLRCVKCSNDSKGSRPRVEASRPKAKKARSDAKTPTSATKAAQSEGERSNSKKGIHLFEDDALQSEAESLQPKGPSRNETFESLEIFRPRNGDTIPLNSEVSNYNRSSTVSVMVSETSRVFDSVMNRAAPRERPFDAALNRHTLNIPVPKKRSRDETTRQLTAEASPAKRLKPDHLVAVDASRSDDDEEVNHRPDPRSRESLELELDALKKENAGLEKISAKRQAMIDDITQRNQHLQHELDRSKLLATQLEETKAQNAKLGEQISADPSNGNPDSPSSMPDSMRQFETLANDVSTGSDVTAGLRRIGPLIFEEFDVEAKIKEIDARPSRKATFGQVLPNARKSRGAFPHRESKKATPPPLDGCWLRERLNHKGEKITVEENVTIDEFMNAPANAIPMRVRNSLAYRDGNRDARGRLRRARQVFKVGRRTAGNLD